MGSNALHWVDIVILLSYVVVLIVLSLRRPSEKTPSEVNYLLSGRKLSLPAFVATLVSTWYGGILGVGEFSYLYGISQWVVFGLPYYLFAVLFALFLSDKIRVHPAISIPEAIGSTYGRKASKISAVLIFLLVNPAPYILMVALIAQYMIGLEGLIFPILVAGFSALYVAWGGFGAVVRTDVFQAILMYVGFAVLLVAAWQMWGSPVEMWVSLPDLHREPSGGQSYWYLAVWFFIALWTFVDPSFHQRASAAKSRSVARNGILVSVGFWFIFDMMALLCALYAVSYIPGIEQAALIFPILGETLLPVGVKGLFYLTLLATIMSTLDSYLFLAGQTLGRDFLSNWFPRTDTISLTRISIGIAAVVGVVLVWLLPSVIELWYVVGSVLIPGLLFPVLGVYFVRFRVPENRILYQIVLPVGISLMWLLLGAFFAGTDGGYAWLGIEPFYPGLVVALLIVAPTFLSASGKD